MSTSPPNKWDAMWQGYKLQLAIILGVTLVVLVGMYFILDWRTDVLVTYNTNNLNKNLADVTLKNMDLEKENTTLKSSKNTLQSDLKTCQSTSPPPAPLMSTVLGLSPKEARIMHSGEKLKAGDVELICNPPKKTPPQNVHKYNPPPVRERIVQVPPPPVVSPPPSYHREARGGSQLAWMHPAAQQKKVPNVCFFEEKDYSGIHPEYCTKGVILPKASSSESRDEWTMRANNEYNRRYRQGNEPLITRPHQLGATHDPSAIYRQ